MNDLPSIDDVREDRAKARRSLKLAVEALHRIAEGGGSAEVLQEAARRALISVAAESVK